MTTKIACSVCRAVVAPGAITCPGCGLPLVAQAVPVIAKRRSAWPVILCVFAVLTGICWIGEATSGTRTDDQARAAELSSALTSGKLATPGAFEARCGAPQSTQSTTKGTELRYPTGYADLKYVVTFAASEPRFQMEHVEYHSNGTAEVWRDTRDAKEFFARARCK